MIDPTHSLAFSKAYYGKPLLRWFNRFKSLKVVETGTELFASIRRHVLVLVRAQGPRTPPSP